MINIKRLSKSALILLPLLTISLFPKDVNAANLTEAQFRAWCLTAPKEPAKYKLLPGGAAGVRAICTFKRDGKEMVVEIKFDQRTLKNPNYCLKDKDGDGEVDINELEKRHKNKFIPVIEFSDLNNPNTPPIQPSVLSSLDNASQNLFSNIEFNIWESVVPLDQNNLEFIVDLTNVPTLDQDSIFADTGFTEMNLVYRDAMGSFSGITLASLTQGEENSLEFPSSLFEPFGGFSTWQFGVTVYNPTTEQSVLTFEDKVIPEPSALIGLFAVSGLGFASKLKKKSS